MAKSMQNNRCHLDWGATGAWRAAERGDIAVIVDVLSFSTSIAIAVGQGARIYPCMWGKNPEEIAKEVRGEVAVRRRDVPGKGRFSLSPHTYKTVKPGTRIVLTSPNGASCSVRAAGAPFVFVGALVNAQVVAQAVLALMKQTDVNLSVIACGEMTTRHAPPKELRFALEDYLGAGAILSFLPFDKSPEAEVCEKTFRICHDELPRLLLDCESGRELVDGGYKADVTLAAQLNTVDAVPSLKDGCYTILKPGAARNPEASVIGKDGHKPA